MVPTCIMQEVESLRAQGRCRVESCKIVFLGLGRHCLFTCSDTFAVGYIVKPQCTVSQTDRRTYTEYRQTTVSLLYCGIIPTADHTGYKHDRLKWHQTLVTGYQYQIGFQNFYNPETTLVTPRSNCSSWELNIGPDSGRKGDITMLVLQKRSYNNNNKWTFVMRQLQT